MNDSKELKDLIGVLVKIMVDVGGHKPFTYSGIIESVNDSFITLRDRRIGITQLLVARIISIQKMDDVKNENSDTET